LNYIDSCYPCLEALHQAGITGKGVAIAVVSGTVDYSKNDFRNRDGTTRLIGAYPQNRFTVQEVDSLLAASHPYNAYTSPIVLLDGDKSNFNDYVHGTVVASIACGNGTSIGYNNSVSMIKGMAPEASIIDVYDDLGYSGPLQYIDSISSQLNMPYVICNSMVLDYHYRSFFQDFFGRNKKGRAFVSAAGNFAVNKYAIIMLNAGDTGGADLDFYYDSLFLHTTLIDSDQVLPQFFYRYNRPDSNIDLTLRAYYPAPFEAFDSSVCLSARQITDSSGFFADSIVIKKNTDSLQYRFYLSKASGATGYLQNGYSVYLFSRSSLSVKPSRYSLSFRRKNVGKTDSLTLFFGYSTNQYLHSRNITTLDPFDAYRPAFALKPYMTMMDGLTYDTTAIVVGAYQHRTPGQPIWEPSSRGPNYFGQIKPDIMAPGYDVYALIPSMGTSADSIHLYCRGTSFAAPFVAGLTALLLQQNPSLDQEEIRDLLHATAVRDSITGLTPNNDYGWGRLNFQALCDYIVSTEKQAEAKRDDTTLLCRNYPNPFNPATRIYYQTGKMGTGVLSLFNPSGRLIFRKQIKGNGSFSWAASGCGSGIYFCQLKSGDRILARKMIFAK
jgi:subtilisin family serine protease